MPPAVPDPEASAAFPPTTPVCVRAKSMHPFSSATPPHTISQSPFAQQSPQKPLWPPQSQSAVPASAMSSFPLDPVLGGPDMYSMSGHGVSGMNMSSPESGFIPMSTSTSTMPVMAPHYPDGPPSPMHLMSQYGGPNGVGMDPRTMQRSHSGPGPFRASGSQFLYYHQISGLDRQPIAWSARDVALRSPPAPRQRSAKACKKCRKRKTKCSGGLPCARCVARGLECEYDEKSTLRGPVKARVDGRSIPPPMPHPDTTGSDSSRASSRSDQRHQPYPPNRQSPIAMEQALSQERNIPHARHPYMMQLLGIAPGGAHAQELATGYPPYGLTPAPTRMEMSAMVDRGMRTGSYASAMPLMQHSVSDCSHLMHSSKSDSSDGSRPASACSGSSFNSEGMHFDSVGRDIIWPSNVSDHFHASSIPPPLSTSSSSSSLKDALVELPYSRQNFMTTRAQAPGTSGGVIPAEFATKLTNILRDASIESAPSYSYERALPPSPSNSAPALSNTPDSWTSSLPSPLTPHSSQELQFEDVFNLSPSTSGISPSSSVENGVTAEASDTPTWDVSPQTIRAKGHQAQIQEHYEIAEGSNVLGVSTSSLDLKTPRATQLFRFDYDASASLLSLTTANRS